MASGRQIGEGSRLIESQRSNPMQVRQFAFDIVHSQDLAHKLRPAGGSDAIGALEDDAPGPPLRPTEPGRPAKLAILPARQVKVPSMEGLADPAQRPRILHALANHELQAAELYAWALLAYPEAPADFRRDLLRILDDEQRHTRMYIARLEAHGARFGDFGVSGYFWNKVPHLTTPLHFVCAMALTFENANLDHTTELARRVRRAGDVKTAHVIERVHQDEIEHVRFGWRWLEVWRGDEDPWEVYRRHLVWPLRPARAKGKHFHPEGRRAAGLAEDFIRRLQEETLDLEAPSPVATLEAR